MKSKHYNIPVFVSHRGCPFDCAFCNQKRIAGTDGGVTPEQVPGIVETYLNTIPTENSGVELAFFGGSFTGIPEQEQRAFLEAVQPYLNAGKLDGIRLSTRPDYITPEILMQLKRYGVTTIELGVQSIDRDVLMASRRGHTGLDAENASALIREYDISLGLQMMTGLPKDTPEKALATAEALIALKPDFVRIYPTLVVKDTLLETWYREGRYIPQTLEEAVALCKELKQRFRRAQIPVIRISLQTTEEIAPGAAVIAGPFHSAFGELVENALYYDLLSAGIRDGKSLALVHPGEVSKAVGNGKRNLRRAWEEFGVRLKIETDIGVPKGEVRWMR